MGFMRKQEENIAQKLTYFTISGQYSHFKTPEYTTKPLAFKKWIKVNFLYLHPLITSENQKFFTVLRSCGELT